jgi:hypothetical protein
MMLGDLQNLRSAILRNWRSKPRHYKEILRHVKGVTPIKANGVKEAVTPEEESTG